MKTTLERIKKSWNAQADAHNQWDSLSIDEMLEYALNQSVDCAGTPDECISGMPETEYEYQVSVDGSRVSGGTAPTPQEALQKAVHLRTFSLNDGKVQIDFWIRRHVSCAYMQSLAKGGK